MRVRGDVAAATRINAAPLAHVLLGLQPTMLKSSGSTGAADDASTAAGGGAGAASARGKDAKKPAAAAAAGKAGTAASGPASAAGAGAPPAPKQPEPPAFHFLGAIPLDCSPLLAGASGVAASFGDVRAAARCLAEHKPSTGAHAASTANTPADAGAEHSEHDDDTRALALLESAVGFALHGNGADDVGARLASAATATAAAPGTPSSAGHAIAEGTGASHLGGGAAATSTAPMVVHRVFPALHCLQFFHVSVVVTSAHASPAAGSAEASAEAAAAAASAAPSAAGKASAGTAKGGKAGAAAAAAAATAPAPTEPPKSSTVYPPRLFSPSVLRELNPLVLTLASVDGLPGITLADGVDAALRRRVLKPHSHALLQRACRPAYALLRFLPPPQLPPAMAERATRAAASAAAAAQSHSTGPAGPAAGSTSTASSTASLAPAGGSAAGAGSATAAEAPSVVPVTPADGDAAAIAIDETSSAPGGRICAVDERGRTFLPPARIAGTSLSSAASRAHSAAAAASAAASGSASGVSAVAGAGSSGSSAAVGVAAPIAGAAPSASSHPGVDSGAIATLPALPPRVIMTPMLPQGSALAWSHVTVFAAGLHDPSALRDWLSTSQVAVEVHDRDSDTWERLQELGAAGAGGALASTAANAARAAAAAAAAAAVAAATGGGAASLASTAAAAAPLLSPGTASAAPSAPASASSRGGSAALTGPGAAAPGASTTDAHGAASDIRPVPTLADILAALASAPATAPAPATAAATAGTTAAAGVALQSPSATAAMPAAGARWPSPFLFVPPHRMQLYQGLADGTAECPFHEHPPAPPPPPAASAGADATPTASPAATARGAAKPAAGGKDKDAAAAAAAAAEAAASAAAAAAAATPFPRHSLRELDALLLRELSLRALSSRERHPHGVANFRLDGLLDRTAEQLQALALRRAAASDATSSSAGRSLLSSSNASLQVTAVPSLAAPPLALSLTAPVMPRQRLFVPLTPEPVHALSAEERLTREVGSYSRPDGSTSQTAIATAAAATTSGRGSGSAAPRGARFKLRAVLAFPALLHRTGPSALARAESVAQAALAAERSALAEAEAARAASAAAQAAAAAAAPAKGGKAGTPASSTASLAPAIDAGAAVAAAAAAAAEAAAVASLPPLDADVPPVSAAAVTATAVVSTTPAAAGLTLSRSTSAAANNGGLFERIVLSIPYDDEDLLQKVLKTVARTNAAALPHAAPALRSYDFSKTELAAAEAGALDIITGVQIIDAVDAAAEGASAAHPATATSAAAESINNHGHMTSPPRSRGSVTNGGGLAATSATLNSPSLAASRTLLASSQSHGGHQRQQQQQQQQRLPPGMLLRRFFIVEGLSSLGNDDGALTSSESTLPPAWPPIRVLPGPGGAARAMGSTRVDDHDCHDGHDGADADSKAAAAGRALAQSSVGGSDGGSSGHAASRGAGMRYLRSLLQGYGGSDPLGVAFLVNPHITFRERAYAELGAFPRVIRLRQPLSKILADPASYASQAVPASLLACLSCLRELRRANRLAQARELRLFPSAEGLTALERKFGDAVTLVDSYGESDPAAHALEEARARAAFTLAVTDGHRAAASDPSATLTRTLATVAQATLAGELGPDMLVGGAAATMTLRATHQGERPATGASAVGAGGTAAGGHNATLSLTKSARAVPRTTAGAALATGDAPTYVLGELAATTAAHAAMYEALRAESEADRGAADFVVENAAEVSAASAALAEAHAREAMDKYGPELAARLASLRIGETLDSVGLTPPGGTVFPYSGQRMSTMEWQRDLMRQRLAADKAATFTYSSEYGSATLAVALGAPDGSEPPLDAAAALARPVDRSRWKTASGFNYPARTTAAEAAAHPGKPSDFRIEELSSPWVDAAEERVIAEAALRRRGEPGGEGNPHASRFVAAPDPAPLEAGVFGFTDPATGARRPTSDFFASVHLPPGGVEEEAAARAAAAKAEWEAKVKVADTAFHAHHSGDSWRASRYSGLLADPPRAPGLVAVHAATLPSGKPVPLDTPPVSLHAMDPYKDEKSLATVLALGPRRSPPRKEEFIGRPGRDGQPADFSLHSLVPDRVRQSHLHKPLQAAGLRASALPGSAPALLTLRHGINTDPASRTAAAAAALLYGSRPGDLPAAGVASGMLPGGRATTSQGFGGQGAGMASPGSPTKSLRPTISGSADALGHGFAGSSTGTGAGTRVSGLPPFSPLRTTGSVAGAGPASAGRSMRPSSAL